MNITKKQIIYGTGLLLVGLLIGWLLFSGSSGHAGNDNLSPEETAKHISENHTDEAGNIIYTCSMHPQIRENEPGNCPICGMELIPVRSSATEAREDDYSMVMTAAAAGLADIQTAAVTRSFPQKVLDLPGRIKVDERRITRVTTHFSGRIRDLKVNFTGAPIRSGEIMATIYSSDLIVAQRELLEAARQKDTNPRLYESARQKFRLWEFTDEQIREIENRGEVQTELNILSPTDGYVVSRNVAEEQHVMEGTVIFEVVDLNRVWIVLEAYEEDIHWVSTGDIIAFRTNNGQQYEATVSYIDPVVDPRKRTVGIRADLANPGLLLKPDMLVSGTLQARLDSEKLLVPASSVLWTGPRSLVYVKDTTVDVPRFEVREVVLGVRAGDHYVIEEGVEEGEEVVFHGAFRIDSEMQLADRFSMMNRQPGSGAVPVHDHGEMPDRPVRISDSDTDQIVPDDQASHEHGETVEGVTTEFQNDFRDLLHIYLDGKEAFVASDFDAVNATFQQALVELVSIGKHRMDGDAHMRWLAQYDSIEGHLNQILEAGDIEGQREGFAVFSHVMIEAVRIYEIPGVIYHQYCPMVEAGWLSGEEQIKNPFAPETMLNCGEIIERIE